MSHQFSDGLSGALVEGVEADGTDACGGAVIGEHRERGEGGGELLIEGRVRSAVVGVPRSGMERSHFQLF